MRVGLFGGSFDPPHRGHLLVAQAAQERYDLDHLLLAPTGRQPLKPRGHGASFEDRLAMTRLLCESGESRRLTASDVDAPRADGEPNYTVDTLARLQAMLAAQDEIFVVVGADAFLDLRRWRNPERLLALAEWIVISRPGVAPDALERLGLTEAQRERVHWLGDVWDAVSATEIRARLQAGLDCSDLVPGPVLGYIHDRGLYTGSRAP